MFRGAARPIRPRLLQRVPISAIEIPQERTPPRHKSGWLKWPVDVSNAAPPTRCKMIMKWPIPSALIEFLRPLDDVRARQARLTSVVLLVAKVISLGVNLLTIPIALHALGTAAFGVWITVVSLQAILSFADLGIGNMLVTTIAQASGRGDNESIRRDIASGAAVLTASAVGLAVLVAAATLFLPWNRILNVGADSSAGDLATSIAIVGFGMVLCMPLALVAKLQTAFQRGYESAAFGILSSFVSLIGIVLSAATHRGLSAFVASSIAGSVLSSIANAFYFFLLRRRDLRPRVRYLEWPRTGLLFRQGLVFFALQMSIALGTTTDNLIASNLLGSIAAGDYAVHARLFSISTVLLMVFLIPLWPAYGEALGSNDHEWIRKTLYRSLRFSIAASACISLALLFAGPTLLRLWVGGRLPFDSALGLGLSLWCLCEAWNAGVAPYLNGTMRIKLQLLAAITYAPVSIGLRFALVPLIGVAGIPLGSAVAYLLTNVLPVALHLRGEASGVRAMAN